MHLKFFEYIVIYLSVLVACVMLGTLARLSFLSKGADEYTANIIFWSCTALSVIVYAIIILFLDGILVRIKKLFPKNDISTITDEKIIPTQNFNKIREEQQKLIIEKEQSKKDIAINYTQNQFAFYTSEDDLKLLCHYVELYSEKNNLENIKPIKVEKLSNLDLYHFGWNIWKHFNVRNQFDTAVFLKTIFAESLKEVESESIKRHLKDDEMKGIITIRFDF